MTIVKLKEKIRMKFCIVLIMVSRLPFCPPLNLTTSFGCNPVKAKHIHTSLFCPNSHIVFQAKFNSFS